METTKKQTLASRSIRTLNWFFIGACVSVQLHATNVITDWNSMASKTIVANAGISPAASAIWFAYTSLAMYDAVNAITGQYQPVYYRTPGASDASTDAASAAAAHRILVNYFPSQQSPLDALLATSIAGINASPQAVSDGKTIGEAAAQAVISARARDGLAANVSYVPGSGPGAWIPTPPNFPAPVTPWLGQMRPFTMRAPDDFLPDPPPALASETWKRDYNLTHLYGGTTSTARSAAEAEIGIFWTEHTGQQYARAFNNLVENYNLSTTESARLLAMLWTGFADAGIACFNAKYKYGFWRPVTAIQAGGGSSDLTADSAWLPLGTTPGHPEYPAAHGCVTGAVSSLIASYFGTTRVNILTDSVVFTDGVHQHVFEDSRDLMDEVFWARIYAGFHYHNSLQVGQKLGETVARQLVRTHFQRAK